MVSIRRRRLLGLCSGRNSFPGSFPRFFNNGLSPVTRNESTRTVSVHPMPSLDAHQPTVENTVPKASPESSNPPNPHGSNPSKEEHSQQFPGKAYYTNLSFEVIEEPSISFISSKETNGNRGTFGFWKSFPVKRRKRHRRKHFDNQEPCVMRGVYFKNMKWQAAIKVDKKQIHLGTVGSQEEAARLYDRAAFMCGREPNFELSEEEKQELRKFKWDEFLALTRSAINTKKQQRRVSSRMKFELSSQNSDWETEQGGNGLSDVETSVDEKLFYLN